MWMLSSRLSLSEGEDLKHTAVPSAVLPFRCGPRRGAKTLIFNTLRKNGYPKSGTRFLIFR